MLDRKTVIILKAILLLKEKEVNRLALEKKMVDMFKALKEFVDQQILHTKDKP